MLPMTLLLDKDHPERKACWMLATLSAHVVCHFELDTAKVEMPSSPWLLPRLDACDLRCLSTVDTLFSVLWPASAAVSSTKLSPSADFQSWSHIKTQCPHILCSVLREACYYCR